MSRLSPPELLVLHAVRLAGMAGTAAIARRFALDPAQAEELVLDDQALGLVTWSEFAGTGGWSLTERGRLEDERRLAAELGAAGCADAVHEAHRAFLPDNERLRRACTDWQLRPVPGDPLAANDHTDAGWDRAVLAELEALSGSLERLTATLGAELQRFRGYDVRFAGCLRRALDGDRSAVDAPGRDSCHTVWFELHEDLIATLGLSRAT